jgi:hypothetical protein
MYLFQDVLQQKMRKKLFARPAHEAQYFDLTTNTRLFCWQDHYSLL